MADRLLVALAGSAARRYDGEAVSELEHALQCAELARDGAADEELQLACLLHDVGRYAIDQSLVADTLETARTGAASSRSAIVVIPWRISGASGSRGAA